MKSKSFKRCLMKKLLLDNKYLINKFYYFLNKYYLQVHFCCYLVESKVLLHLVWASFQCVNNMIKTVQAM